MTRDEITILLIFLFPLADSPDVCRYDRFKILMIASRMQFEERHQHLLINSNSTVYIDYDTTKSTYVQKLGKTKNQEVCDSPASLENEKSRCLTKILFSSVYQCV